RGGAGGVIGAEMAAKSPPDGYTLLVAAGSFWIGPLLRDTPYDPVRDFSPISMVSRAPNVVAVHPSLPVKSVKELIALAKARPGVLNYSSGATGSSSHLSGELFKALAGVNIVRIPYKGTAPALNDLIAGQVHLMFPTASAVAPHLKSGRLRALGVTSAEPSVLFPGLPAVAAMGLSGYEAVSMTGIFAPAGTPATIINRLNREVVRVLNMADVKEKLFRLGVEPVGSSPEELAAKIKYEMTRLGKVIRDAGVRAD
ncbi:MAG: tripartite tricarboxylate transporter substrate binding protein, partial [Betaproteobacteria bacterium]|nr:tripartite tricarboxylate transporter substrate binding protein [Betaproteobacteria bacterium]